MKKRIGFVGAVVAVLSGIAPAAHASAVEFVAGYELGPQGGQAGAEGAEDTGFQGFCAKDACTGIQLSAVGSNLSGGTTSGRVTVRGYLCVLDSSAVCTRDGLPYTGVRFTETVVDTPEPYGDAVPVDVTVCTWRGAMPATCYVTAPLAEIAEVAVVDDGNFLEGPAPAELQ
jgi:hypothetical protein